MATTYTTRTALPKPADGDIGWGATWRAQMDALDALQPIGALATKLTEVPSASLNVAVAAGTFRSASGTVASYAGTGSVTLTASATNSIYLTDTGTLTVSTSGVSGGNIVPVAVVVTGVTTITSIADARTPWFSRGGHSLAGVGTPTIAAGPGAGTTPSVAVAGSDQAGLITITTGTTPTASAVVATLTFGQAFAATPRAVNLIPASSTAAGLSGSAQVWPDAAGLSTTAFTLNVGGTALTAATTYKWFYTVIG